MYHSSRFSLGEEARETPYEAPLSETNRKEETKHGPLLGGPTVAS